MPVAYPNAMCGIALLCEEVRPWYFLWARIQFFPVNH